MKGSNKKINKKSEFSNNKKVSSGFTLIELLATLAILSIVISLVIYVSINVINNSKEKTYEVTINEIESKTNDYLIENSNELFFVTSSSDDSIEYQCIQVKNLVDMGYFDNDIEESPVSKNDTVSLDDYIYIERDSNSKTVEITEYLYDGSSKNNLCENSNVDGYIYFSLSPLGWAKKKELVINYVIKNDFNKADYEYKYEYSYVLNNEEKKNSGESESSKKELTIDYNGIVYAYIYDNSSNEIANASIDISKIDNIGPVITVKYDGYKYIGSDVVIPFEVTDVGIGVDYGSFTLDDLVVKINGVVINDGLTFTDNGDGKYSLKIVNKNYNGDLDISISSNKVLDKLGNGNSSVSFSDVVYFDTEPPTCRLSVTTSGVGFDKKIDNGEIISYGINKTGDAVYDNSNLVSLSTGKFYGYVKDTAGNVGSCSAEITDTYVSEYIQKTSECKKVFDSYNCWRNPNYYCPKNYEPYDSTWCRKYYTTSAKKNYCSENYLTKSACENSGRMSCSWSSDTGECKGNYYTCSSGTLTSNSSGYYCYGYYWEYYYASCSFSNYTGTYSNGYCYLYGYSSCPTNWEYSSTYNYVYKLGSSSSTNVSSCSPNTFTCNSSNVGKSYVTCEESEYSCSTGIKVNDDYCYVINE